MGEMNEECKKPVKEVSMLDFEKSDKLLAEVWKLPLNSRDEFLEILFNYLYGDKGFNEAVEKALDKMKVPEEK